MTKRRIAIAGFQHETNSFAPTPTGWAEFEMADSWPELLEGDAVITGTHGMNLPIAGAVSAAEANAIDIVPILWCAAEPGGLVTDEAFGQISRMIRNGVAAAGQIDALYLDLHGAMVTQSHDDGEAALLAALRADLGPELPIAVSLDLHANISAEFVANADIVTIYRTYPHLDMAATGHRAIDQLVQYWKDGQTMIPAFRQVPFLIPLQAQYTGAGACHALYKTIADYSTNVGEYAELALGFTAADIPDCGPSIITYAYDAHRAEAMADHLLDTVIAAAPTFETAMMAPDDAVAFALQQEGVSVLADVQDNPGAGGASDSTGLLRALIKAKAQNAVIGILCDPEIAALAHQAGTGTQLTAPLGGKSAGSIDPPITATFTVQRISDGSITYSGEMYGGGVATMGPSCVLSLTDACCDIQIVVSSNRIQCLDQALFTELGVDLATANLICVKSTVHYRADFDPICDRVINVASPGLFQCDLTSIAYKKATRPSL